MIKLLKLFLVSALLVSMVSYVYSASKGKAPLIGHWSWQQLTVDHPDNTVTYQGSPSLCIGDVDVKADGTFKIWNTCKIANTQEKHTVESQGTWYRVSANAYKACYEQCYDIFVDKTGKMAMFAAMSTADAINTGHFEWGHMFKDVYFDHAAMQQSHYLEISD